VSYTVSGSFAESNGGLLQLEVVSPVDVSALLSDLAGSWLERNLRNPPPP
jgi:hypothetical protein